MLFLFSLGWVFPSAATCTPYATELTRLFSGNISGPGNLCLMSIWNLFFAPIFFSSHTVSHFKCFPSLLPPLPLFQLLCQILFTTQTKQSWQTVAALQHSANARLNIYVITRRQQTETQLKSDWKMQLCMLWAAASNSDISGVPDIFCRELSSVQDIFEQNIHPYKINLDETCIH